MSYRPLNAALWSSAAREDVSRLISWRLRGIAGLRIAFGCVWSIDAWLKWQPGFSNALLDYTIRAPAGQAAATSGWLSIWLHIVGLNPHLFAIIVALAETGIALGLLFGLLNTLICLAGILLSLGLWSLASGVGAPFWSGSTDSGVLVVTILVFTGLLPGNAGTPFGLDRYLSGHLGRWNFLASRKSKREQFRRGRRPLPAPVPLPTAYPALIHSAPGSRRALQTATQSPYRHHFYPDSRSLHPLPQETP